MQLKYHLFSFLPSIFAGSAVQLSVTPVQKMYIV
jgi:hypothetical protein